MTRPLLALFRRLRAWIVARVPVSRARYEQALKKRSKWQWQSRPNVSCEVQDDGQFAVYIVLNSREVAIAATDSDRRRELVVQVAMQLDDEIRWLGLRKAEDELTFNIPFHRFCNTIDRRAGIIGSTT